jgi:hypothetical protein
VPTGEGYIGVRLPNLGGQFDHGFHVAFADGSVFLISKTIDVATLRALITRDGAEAIATNNIPSTPPRGRVITSANVSATPTPEK